jgi:hypothetical protein
MDEATRNWAIFGTIVAFLLITIFYPLGVIWALNNLFGLGFAYTLTNWFSVWILMSIFSIRYTYNKNKDNY